MGVQIQRQIDRAAKKESSDELFLSDDDDLFLEDDDESVTDNSQPVSDFITDEDEFSPQGVDVDDVSKASLEAVAPQQPEVDDDLIIIEDDTPVGQRYDDGFVDDVLSAPDPSGVRPRPSHESPEYDDALAKPGSVTLAVGVEELGDVFQPIAERLFAQITGSLDHLEKTITS